MTKAVVEQRMEVARMAIQVALGRAAVASPSVSVPSCRVRASVKRVGSVTGLRSLTLMTLRAIVASVRSRENLLGTMRA